MAFSDYSIPAFSKTVSMLPDTPDCTPEELKSQFDAAPEQLRASLNGVCAEAQALDERVSGLLIGAFPDTVSETMLTRALQDKINSKVDPAQLAEEAQKREALTTLVNRKISVSAGRYTGNGDTARQIPVDGDPIAILVMNENGVTEYNSGSRVYGGLALWQHSVMTAGGAPALSPGVGCFFVYYSGNGACTNQKDMIYHYFVLYQ